MAATALRDDIMLILMQKMQERSHSNDFLDEQFANEKWIGKPVSGQDILRHLEYLEENGYIQADLSKGSSGNDSIAAIEVLQDAKLTEKGTKKLEELKQKQNVSESDPEKTDASTVEKNSSFLTQVKERANLPDLYDARDITVVIFRTMRDMMSTEAADRIARDLQGAALPTDNKLLQQDVADLWNDTNPLVRFLSRIRAPLDIDDELFLRRIRQEAGLPPGVEPEQAIAAVFAATKDELPDVRVQEITTWLPGKIRVLWTDV